MTMDLSARPSSTALRVALWRALHLEIDSPPHVLEDKLGLELFNDDPNWRNRPDMDPRWTKRIRASIVARSRFVEDMLAERVGCGISQYVLLGAGLDTLAQRNPSLASKFKIFEVDQVQNQVWKKQRLLEKGYPLNSSHHFVSVDFEKGDSWWDILLSAGFDANRASVIASTGVSMYLTNEANHATLKQLSQLPKQSTFVMTFLRPLELIDVEDREMAERSFKGAEKSGTPFISCYSPEQILSLAKVAGFKKVEHISAQMLTMRYFDNRTDKLKPSNGEELIVATT